MSTLSTPTQSSDPASISAMLKGLHMSGMEQEYSRQLANLGKDGLLPFDVRLEKMCEAEITRRNDNGTQKRLREAHLFIPMACMEQVQVLPEREINMELYKRLATCDFIKQKRNVAFEGATGTGKTYLASAIGNAACRRGYRVCCVRLPDLLNQMTLARRQGTATKMRDSYLKYDLLAIDEWLLYPITIDYTFELLEIVDACSGKCSLLFCTQYPHSEWYKRIDADRPSGSSSTLAEAILDRIIHRMDVVSISSKSSMRKRYSATGEPNGNTESAQKA